MSGDGRAGAPQTLKRGQVIVVGGKLYGRCAECGDVIRMDKPIFGSLHFCDAQEVRHV